MLAGDSSPERGDRGAQGSTSCAKQAQEKPFLPGSGSQIRSQTNIFKGCKCMLRSMIILMYCSTDAMCRPASVATKLHDPCTHVSATCLGREEPSSCRAVSSNVRSAH